MIVSIPINEEGTQVIPRTGKAPYYGIYKVNPETGEFEMQGKYENGHSREPEHKNPEEHTKAEIDHHRKHLKGLRISNYMLCFALGPNMKDALKEEGIDYKIYKKKDGDSPADLIRQFAAEMKSD